MNDLKSAIRQLLKNPGFTGVAVLTLALGIGASPAKGAAAIPANPSLIPSTSEILERNLDAMGGREVWLAHPSYHATGTFELSQQGAHGTLEIISKRPNKSWIKVEIPGAGRYLRATDGKTMWHFNPQPGYRLGQDFEFHARQGLKQADDERQHRLIEMLDYFSPLQPSTGAVSETNFNGIRCWALQSTRRNARVIELFDAQSGARIAATYPDANAEAFLIGEPRAFGTVTVPCRIIRTEGGKTNDVFTITSFEFAEVPDAKFALPVHLPSWPADWHQIDEAYPPPSFAQNLPWPWKGEHRRWFNEGFAKTNDVFFWSYVVLNALEGDTLKTAAELHDALHRYDASLYGKAFPPEKIQITIGAEHPEAKSGHRLTRRSVTIDGFDAESTSRPLQTHLETFRWYCPTADRTLMLVLRSPRQFKTEDEVWRVLLQFRDGLVCHSSAVAQPSAEASTQSLKSNE